MQLKENNAMASSDEMFQNGLRYSTIEWHFANPAKSEILPEFCPEPESVIVLV